MFWHTQNTQKDNSSNTSSSYNTSSDDEHTSDIEMTAVSEKPKIDPQIAHRIQMLLKIMHDLSRMYNLINEFSAENQALLKKFGSVDNFPRAEKHTYQENLECLTKLHNRLAKDDYALNNFIRLEMLDLSENGYLDIEGLSETIPPTSTKTAMRR